MSDAERKIMGETNIIAVDFDGTLCENKYPEIGKPNKTVIDALLLRQKDGAKIILWTCRCGKYLKAAVKWCKEHGIVFDAVNRNLPEMRKSFKNDSRKVFAREYWDDRAVNTNNFGNFQHINNNPAVYHCKDMDYSMG